MAYFTKLRPDNSGEDGGDEEQNITNQWIAFGSRVAIRIAIHPLEYAKVLIQVIFFLLIS